MDASTDSHRVPVVVFDDGSLTRGGLERVARYASSAELVGGVRGPSLTRLLGSLGVPVRDLGMPEADVGTAVGLAAAAAAVLVSGAPLDPAAWLADLGQAAAASGRTGLVAHIPDPGNTHTLRLAALTPSAVSWAGPVGSAFGTVSGLHASSPAHRPMQAAEVVDLLEAQGMDRVVVFAAAPFDGPEPAAAPQPAYAVTAADTILVVLTDTGLELTNRTPVSVRLRIRLGAAGAPPADLGAVEVELAPRESAHRGLEDLDFLAGLEPPHPVVRHWSHETETVYDGGSIRINGLDVRYLAPNGTTIGLGSYGTQQGLHVGVVSTQLGQVLGSSLTSVSGEYGRMAERRATAFSGLLTLLAVPLAAGADPRAG